MMESSRVVWTSEEVAEIAANYIRVFGEKAVVPRRIILAQRCLPNDRWRNFIVGQKRDEIETKVAQLIQTAKTQSEGSAEFSEGEYESTTRLREEGVIQLPYRPRVEIGSDPNPQERPSLGSVGRIQPTTGPASPAASFSSSSEHRKITSPVETPEPPRPIPRIIGTDHAALSRCTSLLEEISQKILCLQRLTCEDLDGLCLHPVDHQRLRSLTIGAADSLSRFEESLSLAHRR